MFGSFTKACPLRQLGGRLPVVPIIRHSMMVCAERGGGAHILACEDGGRRHARETMRTRRTAGEQERRRVRSMAESQNASVRPQSRQHVLARMWPRSSTSAMVAKAYRLAGPILSDDTAEAEQDEELATKG